MAMTKKCDNANAGMLIRNDRDELRPARFLTRDPRRRQHH
ncbi:MAG: hypothetical protein UX91_C0008G0005 [Candidatus Amesbacteria bacterium GW2011_GWB1_47_19]|nr:MAG: hypothetical protein UW51_C0002G0256 [Candidatus Amesbacteria bacterium GW2011_GWA1_44_24]KKU31035.1 MAG: hypothetical protein UX46_C0008G0055 [Candidatus Amesbacteria bacterium GW2011_GWC1_46_24]KKU66651.1 MAG: hypothetical protein UX91_C0008G0005 [Candidatus Amesbacteria bacterium GW2011_GWB1_47_19]